MHFINISVAQNVARTYSRTYSVPYVIQIAFDQTWDSVVEYESDGATNKHARTEKNSDYLIRHVTS